MRTERQPPPKGQYNAAALRTLAYNPGDHPLIRYIVRRVPTAKFWISDLHGALLEKCGSPEYDSCALQIDGSPHLTEEGKEYLGALVARQVRAVLDSTLGDHPPWLAVPD